MRRSARPRWWDRFHPLARAATLLLLGVLLITVRPALDGAPARYVHIRWRADVSAPERLLLEWRFSLRARQQDGQSFGYDLLDAGDRSVAALLAHPSVDDTAGFDRERKTVRADAEIGHSRTGLAWRLHAEPVLPLLRPLGGSLILLALILALETLLPAAAFPVVAAAPDVTAGRFVELDVLRGIAAMAVVLFHLTSRFGTQYGFPSRPLTSVPLGFYGVHLFFVISGLVIFLTIERSRSVVDFLLARAGRLLPAYWVAVTLTFLVVTRVGLPGLALTAGDYLWNLTMLQRFAGVQDVDGVYWTLQVELAFYALMLVVLACRAVPRIGAILLTWLALLTLDAATGLLAAEGVETSRMQLLTLYGYAPLFIAGIALHLRRARGRWSWGPVLVLVWAVALFASRNPTEATGMVLGAVALVVLAIEGRLAAFTWRPLLWLGAVSYPLYLVHQHIGYVVLRGLYAHHVPTHLGIALAVAVALGLAGAVHAWVEQPGRRLVHGWRRALAGARADG